MKLGQKLKYRGGDYIVKGIIQDGSERGYMIGAETATIDKCLYVTADELKILYMKNITV